jgi:hypothetical protein
MEYLVSTSSSPSDVLGLPIVLVSFPQAISIGCSRSTLCHPLLHQTFLEYLVSTFFHPLDVLEIPYASVLPPSHPVATKYAKRKRKKK